MGWLGPAVRGVVILGAGLVAFASPPAAGAAQDPRQCAGPTAPNLPSAQASPGGLRFGIYPGGVAGQLLLPASSRTEDPARTLGRLSELAAPGAPFVIHQFIGYTADPAAQGAALRAAADMLGLYGAAGYRVELVVRYQANDDVPGYVRFLDALMGRIGSDPHLVALQVTNEVNFTASGDSSDGAFSGAIQALVQGVIAAKARAIALGRADLGVGFNWFDRMDPQTEANFWNGLRDAGGPAFVRALDWVGLDAYPGTVWPPASASQASSLRDEMINGLGVLRDCFMASANLPRRVAVHVSENGWPTGPGRTPDAQRDALVEMVQAVRDYSARYGVTDYRWFDLRDADSSSPNFQQQYGITADDYTPKPAFGAYRDLIRRYSAAAPSATAPAPSPRSPAGTRRRPRAACSSRRVLRLTLGRGARRVRVLVDGQPARGVRRRGRRLWVSLRGARPGAHRVTVLLGRAPGHRPRRVLRTVRTCERARR